MADPGTLDMAEAFALIDEVRGLAERLDGAPLNVEGDNNKARMRANANRSKDLLYAAHVADKLRMEIMDQYHHFKESGSLHGP